MAKVKQTRKDAGAKKKKPAKNTVPVKTPTGSTVNFHSTAEKRKRRRKKHLSTPPDASD